MEILVALSITCASALLAVQPAVYRYWFSWLGWIPAAIGSLLFVGILGIGGLVVGLIAIELIDRAELASDKEWLEGVVIGLAGTVLLRFDPLSQSSGRVRAGEADGIEAAGTTLLARAATWWVDLMDSRARSAVSAHCSALSATDVIQKTDQLLAMKEFGSSEPFPPGHIERAVELMESLSNDPADRDAHNRLTAFCESRICSDRILR